MSLSPPQFNSFNSQQQKMRLVQGQQWRQLQTEIQRNKKLIMQQQKYRQSHPHQGKQPQACDRAPPNTNQKEEKEEAVALEREEQQQGQQQGQQQEEQQQLHRLLRQAKKNLHQHNVVLGPQHTETNCKTTVTHENGGLPPASENPRQTENAVFAGSFCDFCLQASLMIDRYILR
jgi:hypothetical protein